MIERLLENWLTNATELGLQGPFCQLLTFERYRVFHLTRHGEHEQGKDCLAFDPDGVPCAFQLKGLKGKRLTVNAFREMLGQVIDLVEIKIVHPSCPAPASHRPILVLSGELDEQVRRDIDDRNRDRWNPSNGFRSLEVITFRDLVSRFSAAYRAAEPSLPQYDRDLLMIALDSGNGMADKARFAKVIENLLHLSSDETVSKSKATEICASTATTGYFVINQYIEQRNHWAATEHLVVLWAGKMAEYSAN